jgi:alginate O-acetyltransferase complex protein AlgI
MVFSSEIFLYFFLPFVLAGFWALHRFPGAQNVFLCLASLFFYAWGEPLVVFVMVASILANWALALGIPGRPRGVAKAFLGIAVFFNVGLLVFFKYAGFLAENANRLLSVLPFSLPAIPVPSIPLPIGISFFTFQALSYVIDVYRGGVPPRRNPLDVGLYISFFPQLVAGPIIRYDAFAPQIRGRTVRSSDLVAGSRRFLAGLAKKLLLADRLADLADLYFNVPADALSSAPVAGLWLGAVAYAFQILFDFSGYSDMAIGLGRIFGFRFAENFDRPYAASSVTDFWRRWHISLGRWFRDYVYIPLGGNRVSRPRWVANLFAVWLLTGIWHGANWTFVLWGLSYFVLLLLEKVPDWSRAPRWMRPFARPCALLAILLLWVLFRSATVSFAARYLAGMFGFFHRASWNGSVAAQLRSYAPWFVAAVACCLDAHPLLAAIRRRLPPLPRALLREGLLAGLALAVVAAIANSSYSPFIYFNF